MGDDGGVLKIKGSKRGIAFTTDGNGRYCYLDPFVGGEITVAEAARNLSCKGALPMAVTDNLSILEIRKKKRYSGNWKNQSKELVKPARHWESR